MSPALLSLPVAVLVSIALYWIEDDRFKDVSKALLVFVVLMVLAYMIVIAHI